MRFVKASYEILECPDNVLERIERAARTCYKSEDRIGDGSARRLVEMLVKKGHHACLEFGGMITVKFVTNRGFSHEMVRHRLASFAQESTRYCSYAKGQFGGEITVVEPLEGLDAISAHALCESWATAERVYLGMVERGVSPQIARDALPIGLKTEIVVGANTREWMHIFGQRCSRAAHPRMWELMRPLRRELQGRVPLLYDCACVRGLAEKECADCGRMTI